MNSVLKKGSSIIFLQDVRIGNHINLLKGYLQSTKFGNFDLFSNSNKADRGVLILIKKRVSYKVHKIFKSSDDNILILDITINDYRCLLVNVYGPTQTQNHSFFNCLKNKLKEIGLKNFIIAGDLNAISSNLPISNNVLISNIEVLNMTGFPNPTNTNLIVSWLNESFVHDMYRICHPLSRTYSYIPFDKNSNKRSRIDLALCSPNFCKIIADVEYLNLLSKHFDHKCILISFKKKKISSAKSIDSSLLHLEFLFESVKFGVYELFLEHFNIQNKNFLKLCLDRIHELTIYIQGLIITIINFQNDKLLILWKEKAMNDLNFFCNQFPDIDSFLNFDCNIEFDLLQENLFNVVKNKCIVFQSEYIKSLKAEKTLLSNELLKLRNQREILSPAFKSLENKLLNIENKENNRLLQDSRYFEILNHEKPTSIFSSLLKNENSHEKLAIIKDDNNRDFPDDHSRIDFIVNHFKQIFSTPFEPTLSLSEFFGNDNDNPLLNEHKLSEAESLSLEGPITLQELEESLADANLSSSPGVDGVPMKAVKFFWKLLKGVMVKAANVIIQKGELHGILKYSKIRLIPKANSDLTKVKNWRPIGLLCSPYKLVSGVANNRLKKVIDKICHKSQKAYSSNYIIQENLIKLVELLSKSKHWRFFFLTLAKRLIAFRIFL